MDKQAGRNLKIHVSNYDIFIDPDMALFFSSEIIGKFSSPQKCMMWVLN